ncbi:transcriptional regulator, MarR family [Agreia pratensis]|uniref:Transcriptional regulator, MarR family n=1 Tax=Agreia pratensis TaxID=150121 RepID=A0A1X7IPY7_9MICO|nr:transcriptional regulator, MarR family [Agreia pratensis]
MRNAFVVTETTKAPAAQQPFVVDELVCFALYNASHAITQTYRSVLAPWGLTYPQYLVFVVLWNEGAMSLRDLGSRLELDSGTLSPLTKRMEEAGYLERARASDDARVVTIGLTDKGERMREELAAVPACVAGAMKLDLATATQLRGVLKQLADDTRSFDTTQTTGAPDVGR